MNISVWHSAFFQKKVFLKVAWILIRIVIAFGCAQQGTHFIYQGF